MSESFVFDVAYSTTFDDVERLREKMLDFVTTERRDYQPVFDVTVKGSDSLHSNISLSVTGSRHLPQIFLSNPK